MENLVLKFDRDKFKFKFKQYEGMYFHAEIGEIPDKIRYKITVDEEGMELKEFGNTHIKDSLIYIPQVEAYIDLNSLK